MNKLALAGAGVFHPEEVFDRQWVALMRPFLFGISLRQFVQAALLRIFRQPFVVRVKPKSACVL
jgi:hypothetical protein